MKAKLFRDVPFARAGQQTYSASELGEVGDDLVTVDRPADEVAASASSFEGVPVTVGHPSDLLDAEGVERLAVGMVSDIRFDPVTEQVRGDFLLWDAEAIRQVASGVRELSGGYAAEYAPTGNGYRQSDIKGNHVAIVELGRSGAAQRIGG